ncbi:molybdopterin-dependent oxidoreductase [Terrilactibacillus sp. BCM23-1]|uniref:Molybdopterin-dependent oxidoreductase n=1 Tax=Terrilactibacillus tamarindi TaxID=2599694 RepID=A0A6N8CMW9_9BACI|nr:sulfite oxidase [Terrilactibacillus tamarindi]MTT31439.1 molybdopterin-dependent oxidoreductase [Terrilactibacillus tamarindi]
MDRSNHHRVKPYLLTHSLLPENQETPFQFIKTDIMDNKLFYRRNHFSYPTLSYSNYWLPINGIVSTPILLSMQDILHLPSKTIQVVLECSGDKRNLFEPKVFGVKWGKGAISQGYWKGVPLRALLELSGIREGAKEIVVEGYDFGERTDLNKVFTYARSLPIEKAIHPDTIIAYEYNNQPIPFKHGYPLRLIVPQWYAMASVKWIKQISVIDSNFTGPFQTIDYVYYPNEQNNKDAFPVTTINVNSTIQKPLDMEILNTGKHLIKGIAWIGNGFITKLEISVDGGSTWLNAKLESTKDSSYGWQSWYYEWTISKKGEYMIMSKATDSYGQIQPTIPFWNKKGYGYNAIDKIKVKVE